MTIKDSRKRTARSAEARANMSAAAKIRAAAGSDAKAQKVRAMMETILEERRTNGGVYPRNDGVINRLELAKRAGVSDKLFYTEAQKELRNDVKEWVDSFKPGLAEQPVSVRRTLETRVADWNRKYEDLKLSIHKHELELQEAESQRDAARADADEAQQENQRLRELLKVATPPAQNITPMPQRGSRKRPQASEY